MLVIYQGSRTYMETKMTVQKLEELKIPYKIWEGQNFVPVQEETSRVCAEVHEESRVLSFNKEEGFTLRYW
ncbi:MAG: hypothetical protein WC511_02595 [Candidatus Pacearchaeota archaeon]